MKSLGKLLGFALIILGIYWLGKDIILTTQATRYGWQTIPAAGSVVLMLGGLWTLFNASGDDRNFGWMLIGGGDRPDFHERWGNDPTGFTLGISCGVLGFVRWF